MKHYRSLMFLALAAATLGAYSKIYADTDENMIMVSDNDNLANTDANSAENTGPIIPLSDGGVSIAAVPPFVYSLQNTGIPYTTPFPDFDHLPIVRPLPDTLRFFDGTRSTDFADWEARRNEIKASMETFEIGAIPEKNGHPSIPNSAVNVTVAWIAPGATGSIGANTGKLTVTITRPSNGKVVTIATKVWRPAGYPAGTKFAAIIPMNGGTSVTTGNSADYGQIPAAIASVRPIGTVSFPHNSTTTYSSSGSKAAQPFYQMYPELNAGYILPANPVTNSGQYAAWSWGISRLIDGMQIAAATYADFPIDMTKLATVGCSYAGKMSLMGAAFDERVALCFALESGGGGAPPWRISNEIDSHRVIETIAITDYNWFRSDMHRFDYDNVAKLPHDHHDLDAMVAPRALMVTGNTDFNWLSQKSNYVSGNSAVRKVYENFGVGDRFGYFLDGSHGHCSIPTIQNAMLSGMIDKFLLGNAAANSNWHAHPWSSAFNTARWTDWWGTTNPDFSDKAFIPENGTVFLDMDLPAPLAIAPGSTHTTGFQFRMPGTHGAASLQVRGAKVLLDVVNPDGRSYVLRWPANPAASTPDTSAFTSTTFTIPANDNSWYTFPTQSIVAPASFGGVGTRARLSIAGAQASSASGNIGGPGFLNTVSTSDWSPVEVKYNVDGQWSDTVLVTRGARFNSLTSAPSSLGTPFGQMVPVTVTAALASSFNDQIPNVAYATNPALVYRIIGITANQPIVAGTDYTPAVLPTTGTLNTVSLKSAGAPATRTYTLRIETQDKYANKSYKTVDVSTVPDLTPPTVNWTVVTPNSLGLPYGVMKPVTVTVNATDAVDPAPVSTIVCVSSNQAISSPADYTVSGLTANLMNVSGRGYCLKVRTIDASGNASYSWVKVSSGILPLLPSVVVPCCP